MMNIYALWDEGLSLEDLKNIQYLTYWVQSEVVKVQNIKMFNLKKEHSRRSNYESQKCINNDDRNVQYQSFTRYFRIH